MGFLKHESHEGTMLSGSETGRTLWYLPYILRRKLDGRNVNLQAPDRRPSGWFLSER